MRKITIKFSIFILLLSLITTQQSKAQNNSEPVCGTEITEEFNNYFNQIKPQIEYYEKQYFDMLQNRSSTAITSVPIKAHIIRTSAGSGGLSVSDLNDAIDNMNAYYASAFMEFFLCDGINFIDDTSYYNFDTSQESALTSANNVSGLINIYFANSVSSGASGLCGYAYTPGGPDVILMANSCTTNGSTLPHEVGHFFSLRHTHGPSNSTLTTELVDGSNCDTDGDLICDTPADPQLGSSNVDINCIYTGTTTDANGAAFVPDPTNILSYSRKECRTYLSPQQYARIYATYQSVRNNFSCPSFNIDVAATYTRDCGTSLTVDFADNGTGATSWNWDVDGDDIIDYTIPNPSHNFAPGKYDVTLTVGNGSETITRVYSNLIDYETTNINSTQVHLTLETDDWSQETSWEFKKLDGTILASGGLYNGTSDDFITINESFDVDLNECYIFEISDTYGDGICCFSGNGSYVLKDDSDNIIASGGDYGFGESTYISTTTLSTNDYLKSNISLFPNPVTNQLNIKLLKSNDLPDSYEVFNLLGQSILKKRIDSFSDLTIDASSLSQGMYVIKIIKDAGELALPFIKK
jgi:Secretion system C-terminal sorting domain/PKD domain